MTPNWLLQALIIFVGFFIAAFFFFLQQKNHFNSLYSASAAAILIIIVVTLYIKNDLKKNEIASTPSTSTITNIGEVSGGSVHTGSGHVFITKTEGISEKAFQHLAEELGITKAALKSFFKILEQKQVPPEHLDNTLREIANRHKQIQEKLAEFTSEDSEINAIKKLVSEALKNGEFERAESLLNEASAHDLKAAQELSTLSEEKFLRAAASKSDNAELKKSQLAYDEASDYYQQAAKFVPETRSDVLADYLNLFGEALINAGHFNKAEDPFKKSLYLRIKSFGNEDPKVAQSHNNLGTLYMHLGRYHEAENHLKQALSIWENTLGEEQHDVATCLNNLASFYHIQANYQQAELLYDRALEIDQKLLGPFNPQVANTMHNIATLFQDMGKYPMAEKFERRALAIWEDVFGHEHPKVALSFNNVGNILTLQGEYTEAQVFYEQALVLRENVFGAEHPSVAESLYGLAVVFQYQEDYQKALPLHLRSIRIWEKMLDSEHPGMASKLSAVGLIYHKQKKYSEAENYYKRALSILDKVLGKRHPEVSHILNNLGGLYHDQGFYVKAEEYHRKALSIREETLGSDHPDVANSLNSLALALSSQNRNKEAAPLFERSLKILEEKVGSEHPHTILVRKNLLSLQSLDSRSLNNSDEESRKGIDISEKGNKIFNKKGDFSSSEGRRPNIRIPLDVMPQPLKDSTERGRVLFQNPSIGIMEKGDTVLYVCGSCSAPLLTELELIKFSATIAPNTEIVIRCNKCGAYNDATKYVR